MLSLLMVEHWLYDFICCEFIDISMFVGERLEGEKVFHCFFAVRGSIALN